MDAARRIHNAEDRRDVSVIGRGEEFASLPGCNEAIATGGVDADERKADFSIQRHCRGHVQVGGEQAVRARRDVDGKTSLVPRIPIHGISAKAYFPDILKLPRERLELFQLGWRASDESETDSRPEMNTSQPWQVFAWSATRHGELYVYVASANLTREGVSMSIRITSKSWKQKWSKAEAIDLVASGLRRGEWAPVLTMWLGDGQTERRKILQSNYKLVIAAKEPWRLGISIGTEKALVATGKEAFLKLRDSAGVYGELLDLLKAHKWIDIKLATDDVLRAAHKPNKKRGIDVLREVYRHNNSEISTEQFSQAGRRGRNAVVVAGVVMFLNLVSGRGGSLRAKRSIRCVGKALAIAGRFEEMGLRPNIVKAGLYYDVYIATEDLLRLAERDEAVRKAIALYLTEKAENGTPRQREIAEKILQRHPFFYPLNHPASRGGTAPQKQEDPGARQAGTGLFHKPGEKRREGLRNLRQTRRAEAGEVGTCV